MSQLEAFNWRRLAACKTADSRLFMPLRGQQAGPAKAICATCPVKAQCLAEAMSDLDTMGVWGGLTHQERQKLANKRSSRASQVTKVPYVVGVPRPSTSPNAHYKDGDWRNRW